MLLSISSLTSLSFSSSSCHSQQLYGKPFLKVLPLPISFAFFLSHNFCHYPMSTPYLNPFSDWPLTCYSTIGYFFHYWSIDTTFGLYVSLISPLNVTWLLHLWHWSQWYENVSLLLLLDTVLSQLWTLLQFSQISCNCTCGILHVLKTMALYFTFTLAEVNFSIRNSLFQIWFIIKFFNFLLLYFPLTSWGYRMILSLRILTLSSHNTSHLHVPIVRLCLSNFVISFSSLIGLMKQTFN